MHDQSCPALFLVPLEAGKIRQVEFIVSLEGFKQLVQGFSTRWWKEEEEKKKKKKKMMMMIIGIRTFFLNCL